MVHSVIKYSEVYTDLNFISIHPMNLELWDGTKYTNDVKDNLEDGAEFGILYDNIRQELQLDDWRQNSYCYIEILDDLKMSNISLNKIT